MPIRFTVDRSARLVSYVVEADFTFEEARKFLDAVLAHPAFERGFHFFGDRRTVDQAPSGKYIYAVATEVHARRDDLGPCKWAVVVADDHAYGMTRMWGMLTDRSGVEIVPFHSAEEAAAWLGLPANYSPLLVVSTG